jgi:transglutaminase-like putative cysteine protease
MLYSVQHTTWYAYTEPVPFCHNVVHLAPRTRERQTCLTHELVVEPAPSVSTRRTDYFGNTVDYFAVRGALMGLKVTSASKIEVTPAPQLDDDISPEWESLVGRRRATYDRDSLEVLQLTFPSPRIRLFPEMLRYAVTSFPAGQPIIAALRDLTSRIHRDFVFDSRATTVNTPLDQLLQLRRGVCQDFAHLAVGCARSVGLAARYVSGYLRTQPPPGKPRLVGADASHAWASIYCGSELGWIDIDPTNDVFVSDSHISIGWGRDYSDICPIQGVFVGGGDHTMGVSVDVLPESTEVIPAQAGTQSQSQS